MKIDASINTIFISIVIAIFTALYLYSTVDRGTPSKAKVTHDLLKIEEAINKFKLQTGEYPRQEKGLASLLNETRGDKSNGQFLNPEFMEDPWGKQYIYKNRNNSFIYIGSAGPDRVWKSSIEDALGGKLIGDDVIKVLKSK